MSNIVIRVGTLAEFFKLVREGTICLSLGSRRHSVTYGQGEHAISMPHIEYTLALSGVSLNDEIVTLTAFYEVQSIDGREGFSPHDKQLMETMPEAYRLVREHLEGLGDGYRIVEGQIAVDQNLSNLAGVFECLAWDREGWVTAADPLPQSA